MKLLIAGDISRSKWTLASGQEMNQVYNSFQTAVNTDDLSDIVNSTGCEFATGKVGYQLGFNSKIYIDTGDVKINSDEFSPEFYTLRGLPELPEGELIHGFWTQGVLVDIDQYTDLNVSWRSDIGWSGDTEFANKSFYHNLFAKHEFKGVKVEEKTSTWWVYDLFIKPVDFSDYADTFPAGLPKSAGNPESCGFFLGPYYDYFHNPRQVYSDNCMLSSAWLPVILTVSEDDMIEHSLNDVIRQSPFGDGISMEPDIQVVGDGEANVVGVSNLKGQLLCDSLLACEDYEIYKGYSVFVEAVPDNIADFTGWSDSACGSETVCEFTADDGSPIVAYFNAPMVNVEVEVTGAAAHEAFVMMDKVSWRTGSKGGYISSDTCSAGRTSSDTRSCTFTVPQRIGNLKFHAEPNYESNEFDHWSGACSGYNSSCTVDSSTVSETIKAIF